MASGTVEPSSEDRIRLESIATVDLRLLSQSDLYRLSLCSDSALDPHRCEDVVVPKIDRSVFNESAGSRKQTYSRLRLAPRKPDSSFSSSSSSTAAVRGRTPHLRAPTSSTIDSTDPERAENSQIINLFKKLFPPETIGDELIPIQVDPYDSVQVETNPNAVINGKRKRGRPRKNENRALVSAGVAAPAPMEVDAVIKDIVVCENGNNVVDRDKEVVDRHGNAVDLVALGSLENPYGLELQRRTESFKTDEELLEFLKGLNGQWGSRRKKKRIVDAGEFGDVLPKGWKLLLSLKKKEGRVWIYVRRYISPNGRQFVSCKEVSSYLLSLLGLPDPYQLKGAGSSENIQPTFAMAANPVVEDINKGKDIAPSLPSASANVNGHKEQVVSGTGSPVKPQMGEVLKCGKCPMTFTEKDDLLHHQLLSHRRKRSKFATSITDGVIISGGKYQCQFCHKTFSERNRYNGHVGAHKRHHMKNDELSPGVLSLQKSDGPVSSSQVSANESVMQIPITDASEVVTMDVNNEINSASPESRLEAGSNIDHHTDRCIPEVPGFSHDEQCSNSGKKENVTEEFCSEHPIDSQKNNLLGTIDEDDVVDAAELSICLDSIDTTFENDIACNNETTACVSDNCPIGVETKIESLPNSPLVEEKISGAETSVNGDLVCVEESNGEAIPGGLTSTTDVAQNSCITEPMEAMHCPSTIDDVKLNSEHDELGHDLCSNRAGLGEDGGRECKQHDGPQSCLPLQGSGDGTCGDAGEVNEVRTVAPAGTELENGSDSHIVDTFSVNDICKQTDSVSRLERDTIYDDGSKEVLIGSGNSHPGTYADVVTSSEQENSEICLDDSSWKEQSRGVEVNENVEPEEHVPEMGSGGSPLILSGYEQQHPVEIEVDNVSTMMFKETKLGDGQPYCNDEPVFGIGHHPLNTQAINLDFGSLDLFPNGKTFADNNLTGLCSSSREMPKQIGSVDNGLLTQANLGKSFTDVYAMNRVASSSIREPRADKFQNASNNGLMFAFGNDNCRISDVMNNVPVQQPFNFGSSGNGNNRAREQDLTRDSLLNPFYYAERCSNKNNLGLDDSGSTSRMWNRPMGNEIANSGIANKNNLGLDDGGNTSRMWNRPMGNEIANSGITNKNNLGLDDGGNTTRMWNRPMGNEIANSGITNKNNLGLNDGGNTSRMWNRPMGNEIANSGNHQLTIGFGGSVAQSDSNVMPGSMWRVREENLLQGPLAGTSTQQEQSSSWFSSFNEISDKDQSALLGGSGKYDNMPDFGVAQSGHSEPVEFSFLSMQNSNSFPGDGKSMSYNTGMGQAFDSPFWLEKDCLSLNISGRNQVASLCVWCRNEFYHEPQHPGTQAGAIGSMCPTCSTKVPQQFNLF